MNTVGKILKKTREEKLLSLEEVEKHTKIRKELLEALESDEYSKLPPTIFIQGFIKNYGKFLNLDADKLLAVFRRDYASKKHPPLVLKSFAQPIGDRKKILTPSRLIGLTVFLIILSFFIYLWVEYHQFVGAPVLEVTSPKEQQTVDVPSVLVSGKTDSEAKLTVNNQEIGVDIEGNFKEEIKLSSSVNDVVIVATSRFGQSTKTERKVFVKQ